MVASASSSIYLQGKSKTGVLLLHGFTSSPGAFTDLAHELNRLGYTVSAPLIAGHGTTPERLAATNWQDWYHSAEHAYLALAAQVDQVFIVGASFGSCLGIMLAAAHPCAGLVTIAYPRWINHHLAIRFFTLICNGLGIRYFRKKVRLNDNTLIDGVPGGNYPVIPIKSLNDFFFLTGPATDAAMKKVDVPTLIIQSNNDGLVQTKSGVHLMNHIASKEKQLVWISEPHHKLHNGVDRFTIYAHLRAFMLR